MKPLDFKSRLNMHLILPSRRDGRVRLIALVLKTREGKTSGGSNPSLSAWRSRQIGKVIALSRQNLRVRSPSTLLVLRDIYSHRPSKRTGLAVNQRLLGAVPRMGVASL